MRSGAPLTVRQGSGRLDRLRQGTADINVVPFIDITLVLLVVFMVGAPLAVQGVTVQLPYAASSDLPAALSPVVIAVDAEGNYSLTLAANALPDGQRQRSLQQIGRHLTLLARQDADLAVVVRADAAVNYQAVAELLVQVRAAGVQRVGLETRPRPTP